jgi:hypothetical protein
LLLQGGAAGTQEELLALTARGALAPVQVLQVRAPSNLLLLPATSLAATFHRLLLPSAAFSNLLLPSAAFSYQPPVASS